MIYFIQTADNQFLKVGKADNVAKRMTELQTAAPQKLKLLSSIPGGHEQERRGTERQAWQRRTQRPLACVGAAPASSDRHAQCRRRDAHRPQGAIYLR